jgi:hypothetical protein
VRPPGRSSTVCSRPHTVPLGSPKVGRSEVPVSNLSDDTFHARAIEPHHVTFFAPDRPVDGTTVFAVEEPAEPTEAARSEGLLES